jgi:hypothetical protein
MLPMACKRNVNNAHAWIIQKRDSMGIERRSELLYARNTT